VGGRNLEGNHMDRMTLTASVLSAAVGLAAAATAMPASAQQQMTKPSMAAGNMQKCYGINAVEKNDCAAGANACAGQATQARDPKSFVDLAAGDCGKIAGAPDAEDGMSQWTDEQIWALQRGGHDPRKVYAAYAAAVKTEGQPTVILAKTIRGYGMGASGEAQNIAHQQKHMEIQSMRAFRDRFAIPVSDAHLEDVPFIRPAEGGPLVVLDELCSRCNECVEVCPADAVVAVVA